MAASIGGILVFNRIVCFIHKRSFSTGIVLKNSIDKSKTMRKILNKADRKKDKLDIPVYKTTVQPSGFRGPVRSKRQFSDGMKRRARYLSEILYEAVNQVIVSGELGVTVSVTKVEVIPDLSHMNIFWEATGIKEQDEKTQKELDMKAKTLRHFLIQVHTLGQVPRPNFVADMCTARQRQVEEILRNIVIEDTDIETDSEAFDSSSDEELYEVSDMDDETDLSSGSLEENVVKTERDHQFRQNIYGLPHDIMMKKIISAKSTASKRPTVIPESANDQLSNPRIDLKETRKYFRMKKDSSRKRSMREAERDLINVNEDDTVYKSGYGKSVDTGYISDDEGECSQLDQYIKSYIKDDDDDRKGDNKPS